MESRLTIRLTQVVVALQVRTLNWCWKLWCT